MKKLLLIPILFLCIIGYSQNSDSTRIIGNPIKIGNFLVAQNDFQTKMNFGQAKKACAELGNDWRLPTKDELSKIYDNRNKIGGFSDGLYWSSTQVDVTQAWAHNFKYGFQNTKYNFGSFYVRAVKDL